MAASRPTATRPAPVIWTLALGDLSEAQTVTFDAAERWLVVVVDPRGGRAATSGGVAGAWIAGGPLLPTGPLLP